MNLVAYEYVVCQAQRHGVLILSEFAGAAQSLNGALIINPWNTEELAETIHDAVTMPPENRAQNYAKLSKYVGKYTSAWWGESFVSELTRISEQAERKIRMRNELAESNGTENGAGGDAGQPLTPGADAMLVPPTPPATTTSKTSSPTEIFTPSSSSSTRSASAARKDYTSVIEDKNEKYAS
jgi:trehalose 6-phosphate synthase